MLMCPLLAASESMVERGGKSRMSKVENYLEEEGDERQAEEEEESAGNEGRQ